MFFFCYCRHHHHHHHHHCCCCLPERASRLTYSPNFPSVTYLIARRMCAEEFNTLGSTFFPQPLPGTPLHSFRILLPETPLNRKSNSSEVATAFFFPSVVKGNTSTTCYSIISLNTNPPSIYFSLLHANWHLVLGYMFYSMYRGAVIFFLPTVISILSQII